MTSNLVHHTDLLLDIAEYRADALRTSSKASDYIIGWQVAHRLSEQAYVRYVRRPSGAYGVEVNGVDVGTVRKATCLVPERKWLGALSTGSLTTEYGGDTRREAALSVIAHYLVRNGWAIR